MWAQIYRNKEQEMRRERKAAVHAKLMVKDVHRHSPAKAELNCTQNKVYIQMSMVNVQFSLAKMGRKKSFDLLLKNIFYLSKQSNNWSNIFNYRKPHSFTNTVYVGYQHT